MGSRKDLITLGGTSLVERAAVALAPVCTNKVRIIGLPPPSDVKFANIPDEPWLVNGVEIEGPLRGLRTACRAASTSWIAILACDLPFVTPEVFRALHERLTSCVTTANEPDAIVPTQPDERPQPLCSLYRRKPVLAAVRNLTDSKDRSLRTLLSCVTTQYIPYSAFSDLPYAEHLFLNINSPADYDRAKGILQNSGF